MIKLPEPEITLAWCSWTEKWEPRELKHCLARKEDDRIIGYTEAQLKQAVRDALTIAAANCKSLDNDKNSDEYREGAVWCGERIRALIKEIE